LRAACPPCDNARLIFLGWAMNPRVWQNPWRLMLAVNVAVFIGVFLHKISLPPYVPYIHLLVDYHFGFTKRALIGAVVAQVTAKVPVWLVFALAGVTWLITLGLFVQLFRRIFGFDEKHLPLFVFMAGSPFFLKNFMHTLGHFDIYGCLLAICLLLIPARSVAYVLLAAMFSIVLVLIHHIHVLMYVPTIAAIVVLRHYLVSGVTPQNVIAGVLALATSGALFIAVQFFGTVDVPPQVFVDHLQSRMADPSRTDLLSFAYIWYQPLSKEIADTWGRLPHNILGVPVFALLIWLHTPLWRYFAGLIGALASETHRRTVIAALAIVSAGYLVMFVFVFDYSRWVSNWAVCMFLILHAVKMLPASRETPLVPTDDTKTTIFGAIVTLIPRVGIVRPF
jgi:multisubunit Na+/H+ antiporter MnhE subunit